MTSARFEWRPWRVHRGVLTELAAVTPEVTLLAMTGCHGEAAEHLVRVHYADGADAAALDRVEHFEVIEVQPAGPMTDLHQVVLWRTTHPLLTIDLALPGVVLAPGPLLAETGIQQEVTGVAHGIMAYLRALRSVEPPDRICVQGFSDDSEAETACLSERQADLVQAALDAGYYDLPRRVVLKELARDLGIARSTIGEHLQRAESALVRQYMAGRA